MFCLKLLTQLLDELVVVDIDVVDFGDGLVGTCLLSYLGCLLSYLGLSLQVDRKPVHITPILYPVRLR